MKKAWLLLIFGVLGMHEVMAKELTIDWQVIRLIAIARTETTVAQYRHYTKATGYQSLAERQGGGSVYEAGWVRKPGWNWQTPFGQRAHDDEPAVHLSFDEAKAFCQWLGGRLPRDEEWVLAAYTETRDKATTHFTKGKTYPYPSGDSNAEEQCLGDCDDALAKRRGQAPTGSLMRGHGHAKVSALSPGVNGLIGMGGNAWEWVDYDKQAIAKQEPRTRGGSWWYGAAQMRETHVQSKPANTTVAYIGFRCAKDLGSGE